MNERDKTFGEKVLEGKTLEGGSVGEMLSAFAPTGKGAEETLHAIYLGEADALVIETKDGPRVYTLRDANDPYRELVERMPGAAVVLDSDHTILYCNGGLPRLLGHDGLSGLDMLDLVDVRQRPLAQGLLAAALQSPSNAELKLIAAGGMETPVRASAAPMTFDGQSCVALVITPLDDIEALQTSEANLRESQRRFQMALENSPIAVFEQDLDLRYSWIFNPRLGYSAADVIGRTDADIMDPACVEALVEIKRRVIATGQPTRREVVVAAPGAPLENFDLYIEPRRDASGRIIGIICAATDLTARKQAEQALRDSQRRVQLAAETSGVGVWEWNMLTNEVIWDAEMFRIYGVAPTEGGVVTYQTWADAVLPEDLPEQEAKMREKIRIGGNERREFRLRRQSDGAVRYVQAFETIRGNAQGECERVIGTNLDITERKQAEEALRKSVALNRLAADAARMTYSEFDFKTGRLQLAENFGKVMGYAPPALPAETDLAKITASLMEHVAPEDRERVMAANLEFVAGKFDGSVTYRVIGDDGAARWIEGRWTAEADENGWPARVIAASVDVSAQVEGKIALEAAKAEAERANVAKSKFLAAASHDLRQPVQSLVLLLSLLARQAGEHPKAVATVKMMQSAVGGLNGLLTGILDISRLDAGVVAPEMQPVNIGALIARLSDEYSPRATAVGLKLHSAPRSLWARTDPELLQRALRNLIENALRYTHEGGVLIGARLRGEHVRIDVVDSGIGMDADQQEQIFEEFYQANNPGRAAGEGLGLGLAIVARLAKLLAMKVEVRSNPGRGSRFSLLLPRTRGLEAAAAIPPSTVSPRGCILIIEDNAIVRDSLMAMLDDWGCQTIPVCSGEEALALIANIGVGFDAIIADHRLGAGLTGVATAKEIARRTGLTIPTLVLTGDTDKERIVEIESSGFLILHKPIDAENLRRELAQMLTASAQNPGKNAN